MHNAVGNSVDNTCQSPQRRTCLLTQQSHIQEALLLNKEMIIYEGIPRWVVCNRGHLETTSMIPLIDYKYNYKSAQYIKNIGKDMYLLMWKEIKVH